MKLYPQRRLSSFAGFTLIELLVVMAIILILAGLVLGTAGFVSSKSRITRAQGELNALITLIDRYKSNKGFYPPDNPNDPVQTQLYYELTGTLQQNNGGVPAYLA